MRKPKRGILRRISSRHNNLRTDEIEGTYNFEPELHHSFLMFAEALNPAVKELGGYREVQTTQITSIERTGNIVRFTTANSTYELEEK